MTASRNFFHEGVTFPSSTRPFQPRSSLPHRFPFLPSLPVPTICSFLPFQAKKFPTFWGYRWTRLPALNTALVVVVHVAIVVVGVLVLVNVSCGSNSCNGVAIAVSTIGCSTTLKFVQLIILLLTWWRCRSWWLSCRCGSCLSSRRTTRCSCGL